MNNRSIGLDTECDIVLEVGGEGANAARAIRDELLAEHLGVRVGRVAPQIDA
jgi:hypothetical protein